MDGGDEAGYKVLISYYAQCLQAKREELMVYPSAPRKSQCTLTRDFSSNGTAGGFV